MSSLLNEAALDLHFAAQTRVLQQVLTDQISHNDHALTQKWVRQFNRSCRNDKYARNCLMLLLYGQLKDLGHLSEPFVSEENLKLSLQEVLTEYDGNMTELQATPSEYFQAEAGHEYAEAGHEYANVSPSRLVNRATEPNAKFSPMKQANQVLNQVKVGLHTVPVENNARMLPHSHTHHQFPGHYPSHMVPQQQQQQEQQHYQSQQQGQQHQQQIHQQPQSQHQQHHSQHQPQQQSHHIEQTQQQQDQNLIENVWHFSLQAIDRLDKWRGSDDKLGFFSLCLRPLIIQEPGIRRNVPELDHRLAMVIHQIIDDAAASITAKENAVLQERANQLLRRQELEQLRADLDRREVELRRQEAMALTLSEHQPRSHSPAGDPRPTRYAEERPHPRHLTPTKLPPNAAPLPAGQCTHFQENEQNEGGAAAAREGADINYVCPQCEMEASAVTFNSVEFLQGEQAGEQPQDALMDGESLEESTNGINQQW